jgi:hypothetical protein
MLNRTALALAFWRTKLSSSPQFEPGLLRHRHRDARPQDLRSDKDNGFDDQHLGPWQCFLAFQHEVIQVSLGFLNSSTP